MESESEPLNSKASFDSPSPNPSPYYPDRYIPFPTETAPSRSRAHVTAFKSNAWTWIPWALLFVSLVSNLLTAAIALRTAPWLLNGDQARGNTSSVFDVLTSFDESDLRYQSLDTRYDDLWYGQLSKANGSGILDLPDDEHKDGLEKLGGLAMFHGLHCLWIVRTEIRRAINGEDIRANWLDAAHGNHCMDYLRKTILCFADPTVERPSATDLTHPAADGSLSLDILGHERRMCRNPEALFALRESKMIHQDRGTS